MKRVVKLRMLPTDAESAALADTLRTCSEAASWLSNAMHTHRVRRKFDAHKRFYCQIRERFGLSAQPTIRVIGKVSDAYTTLRAGIDVGTQCGVSVGYLADHPDRWLRRQSKPLTYLAVEAFVRIELAAHPVGVHGIRQPGRCLAAGPQRVRQRGRFGIGWQHPQLDDALHARTLTAGTDNNSIVQQALERPRTDTGPQRFIRNPSGLSSPTGSLTTARAK